MLKTQQDKGRHERKIYSGPIFHENGFVISVGGEFIRTPKMGRWPVEGSTKHFKGGKYGRTVMGGRQWRPFCIMFAQQPLPTGVKHWQK